jgi:phage terminase Nu1 subunit (DNA packaging protein)
VAPPDDQISQAELIRLMKFSRQTAAEWSRRPGCPKVVVDGKTLYRWPAFAEWYYTEKATALLPKPDPMALEEAKKRKLAAEAELAELELAKAKGLVVPVEAFRSALLGAFGRVRAKAREAPGRLTPLLIGKGKAALIRAVLERFFTELLAELRHEDVPDDEPGEAAA